MDLCRRAAQNSNDHHTADEGSRPRDGCGPPARTTDQSSLMNAERILFVTGRLAEPALRTCLDELSAQAGFEPRVAVLGISVAALMTAEWVRRKLSVPPDVARVVLPGWC